MRHRLTSPRLTRHRLTNRRFASLVVLALIVALSAIAAGPAGATPSKSSSCTSCHSGTAAGTVTATPSTATPAPGATYTVNLTIGLTASGNTGYHFAQTDAAGTATTWQAIYGGPAGQSTWTPSMTAPSTPGTYYYKVWCAKGSANSSGMGKIASYSITVPAPAATPAISSLTPAHAQTGASVVIAGTTLGAGGTVRFGGTAAATTAWSATSVTATVPAGLVAGATSVTVTPTGAAASNSLAFTVDAATPPPVPVATLTSLTPSSGNVGSSFVIAGSNLGSAGTVTVGGVTATTSAWGATSISCTVPAGLTVGAKSVVVTPTGAAASNALSYTVTVTPPPATPVVTSVAPGHAQTGASVVIAGSGLGAGGVVSFGGTAAFTTAWSATSVTATVPASLTPGATSVTVTPSGASASNAVAFTVDAPQAPADTTAPVTVAAGLPAVPWCNHGVTVSLTAVDEAGGSGVATIYYTVDGGDPVPVTGTATDVPLTSSGLHDVAFYAKDAAGNAEQVKSVTVGIDLGKPRPAASRAAKVRRGRTATLRYQIQDETPNGGTATVTVAIRNSRGKVVKRLSLGSQPVNTALKATFSCSLRPGTYKFLVRATDAAGNAEAAAAQQTLRVLAGV